VHRLGERCQNQILKLDGVVWQRVHEVEMEVAEELRVVLEDHQHNIHGRDVEAAHGRCGGLPWHEVALDEREAAHQEVLHFVQALQLVFEFVTIGKLRGRLARL